MTMDKKGGYEAGRDVDDQLENGDAVVVGDSHDAVRAV
jgi:hypothetical protein